MEGESNMKKIFIWLFITLIFLIGIILGVVGYTKFFSKEKNNNQSSNTNYPLPILIEEKRETSKDAKTFNVLLSGYGGSGHSGGGLMDAIIVVHVNVTAKKANIISFPRDFWFSGHKINADPSLKDALTGVTGLAISNFISIDFNSFIKMVDLIEGITVDVKKAYTDNFYPVKGKENELCGKLPDEVASLHAKYSGFELEKQFTCRYETISYNVGLHQMNGEEALKYVRSRHGGSDFERSGHQFEVLKAILQKANIKDISNLFNLVNTDLDLDKVNKILTDIGNPLDYAISYLGVSDQNVLTQSKSSAGAYILIPKEGINIKDYMRESL
jgi:anionic cell wall polymer biosynthesis LytR-Cps2A-Psr (LCP) family protein